MMAPMVVYQALNIYTRWKERGPKGTAYACSKSGWFDSFLFRTWFFDCALPMLKKLDGKKVLLGDNLSSHISIEVIDACREHNIAFVCLPPYATDKLQPLDVAIFGPLKRHWRTVLTEYKAAFPNNVGINKSDFPPLLEKVLRLADLGRHLPAGFRKCGLVPVCLQEALSRIPSRDMEVNSEEMRDLMDSTLGEKLEQLRGVNQPAGSKGRGKKIKVAPGRSFTELPSEEEDDVDNLLNVEDEEVEALTVIRRKKKGASQVKAKKSPANFYLSDSDADQPDADPPDEEERTRTPTAAGKHPVGSFVAAVYDKVWYIAQVKKELKIVTILHKNFPKNYIFYPNAFFKKVEGEEEENEIEGLTLLRFMNRIGTNQFYWDKKPDMLRVNNNDILMRTEAPHPVSARYMGFGKKLVANLDKLLRHFVVWFDYQIMKNFSTKMFLKSFYFKLIKSQTTQRLIIESMTKIICQF